MLMMANNDSQLRRNKKLQPYACTLGQVDVLAKPMGKQPKNNDWPGCEIMAHHISG
jgi:hypothetical protein